MSDTHWLKLQISEGEVASPVRDVFNSVCEALAECGFVIDDRSRSRHGNGGSVSGVRKVPSPMGDLPYRCDVAVDSKGGGASISSRIAQVSAFTPGMAIALVATFAPAFLLLILPPAFHAAFGLIYLTAVAGYFLWAHFCGGNRYAALDAEIWAAITRRTGPARNLKRRVDRTPI